MSGKRRDAVAPEASLAQALRRLEPGPVTLASPGSAGSRPSSSGCGTAACRGRQRHHARGPGGSPVAAGAALFLGPDTRIDLDRGGGCCRSCRPGPVAGQPSSPPARGGGRRLSAHRRGEPHPRRGWRRSATGAACCRSGMAWPWSSGLEGVRSQELVRFEGGVEGIAFNLLEDAVGCLLLGPEQQIEEGARWRGHRAGAARSRWARRSSGGSSTRWASRSMAGVRSRATAPARSRRSAPGVVQRQPVVGVAALRHQGGGRPGAAGPGPAGTGPRRPEDRQDHAGPRRHPEPAGVGCRLRLRGHRTEGLLLARVIALLRERGAMDYTVVVAALSSEAAGLPLPRPLCRLHHRRGVHAAGAARARGLRRPLQARGDLPGNLRPAAAARSAARPIPATSSTSTPACWSAPRGCATTSAADR